MMMALRAVDIHQMTSFRKIWTMLIRHRSLLLGAILISLVWTTLSLFLKNEHDSAERAAIQNSTNLAGALEEHLSRSFNEIDRSLKIIRTLYARDPGKFDLAIWLKSNRFLTDDVLQITIVDRNGNAKAGSADGVLRTVPSFRDSESYKVHAAERNDRFVIGKPLVENGNWSLQLSRRID